MYSELLIHLREELCSLRMVTQEASPMLLLAVKLEDIKEAVEAKLVHKIILILKWKVIYVHTL